MTRTSGRSLALIVALLALVASACGSGDAESGAPRIPEGGGFPVTIDAANGSVTIPQQPERIISLSPTSTEMLFALGAGDQVVAVDDNSNYPPEAPTTDLSGFEPNVEAVAEFDPDLVVVSDDVNDILKSLKALDIPAIQQPVAQVFDDTYAQIEQLGAGTGHVAEAAELVGSMQSEIEELAASAPVFDEPPTYYHELDQTFFTATSETFIGQVYSLAGLQNIADAAKGAGTGYPQLSAEYIIDANPDLIFLSDTKCCDQSAKTVAQRPGWSKLTAVKTGAVVELDDDIASRWGPRVVEFFAVVVSALTELETAA